MGRTCERGGVVEKIKRMNENAITNPLSYMLKLVMAISINKVVRNVELLLL